MDALLTHDFIVAMADMFAILPDFISLHLPGSGLTLNGDGSFITDAELSAHLYS